MFAGLARGIQRMSCGSHRATSPQCAVHLWRVTAKTVNKTSSAAGNSGQTTTRKATGANMCRNPAFAWLAPASLSHYKQGVLKQTAFLRAGVTASPASLEGRLP